MVDYLENVCAVRVRRQNRKEKEFIDVIPSEKCKMESGKVKRTKTFAGADDKKEGASAGTVPVQENRADRKENAKEPQQCRRRSMNNGGRRQSERF